MRQREQSIGGCTDWRDLAELHRPGAPAQMAAEVRRLLASGLTVRDISIALRLAPAAVAQALRDSEPLA